MGSRQHKPQTTFSVKWKNHESNLKNQFDQLLSAQAFVDATIVCNDICIRLHKSVMAASSTYLRNILLQLDTREHPVIILQDTDETAMQSLVTFMYTGEVTVSPDRLPDTLRCAETLKITGFLEAYASNPPLVDDGNENVASQSNAAVDFRNDRRREVAPKVATKSLIVRASFDSSESVLPVELVDVSMPGDDAPLAVEPLRKAVVPEAKRGRGRPKKRMASSPQSSSYIKDDSTRVQSAEFVVKLEPPDPDRSDDYICNRRDVSKESVRNDDEPSSFSAKDNSTRVQSAEFVGKAEPSDPDHLDDSSYNRREDDEASSCSTDPDASKHSSTGLPDLPPLSPSSFSCGLESELKVTTKRSRRTNNQQVYTCEICNKVFGRKHHKVQHERIHDQSRATYQCPLCARVYHRRSELVRHQKHAHFDSNSNSNSNS